MIKYIVKCSFPDISLPGCPIELVSFVIHAESARHAKQKAVYNASLITLAMLKHIGENPYVAHYMAADLVTVQSVREWEDKKPDVDERRNMGSPQPINYNR